MDLPALLAFIDMPRLPELIVILVVALLVFGRKLPDVARAVGRSIVEFKKGLRGVEGEVENQVANDPAKQIPPAPAPRAQIPGTQATTPASASGAPSQPG